MVGFAVYDMEQNRPTRQTRGFTDLVAFGHGFVLFIECKDGAGRLSVWQEIMRDAVEEQHITHVLHFCWRSVSEAHEWWEAVRTAQRASRS